MSKKKIVIIGTSPISLFEALYQYNEGNEVVILNKNDEIGCHIWDINNETYSCK